jgi:flagellar M-ring protein FliF
VSVRVDDEEDDGDELIRLSGASQQLAYEQRIGIARRMVTENPKQVAQVVRSWVGEDGG